MGHTPYYMDKKKPHAGFGRKPKVRIILSIPVTRGQREAIRAAARADSRPMAVWVRLAVENALKPTEGALA
jgi:hypothetical protein